MFTPGPTELVIILVIIVIVFGVGKMPEAASGLGKGLRNFKKALKGEDEIDISPAEQEEKKKIETGKKQIDNNEEDQSDETKAS